MRSRRSADLPGERVVQVILVDARDHRVRGRGQQAAVARILVDAADAGQVLRVVGEAAAVAAHPAFVVIFAVQIDVEALRLVIAIAGGQVGALVARIALLGEAAFDRAADARIMLFQDQVDHAADRVGAIGR